MTNDVLSLQLNIDYFLINVGFIGFIPPGSCPFLGFETPELKLPEFIKWNPEVIMPELECDVLCNPQNRNP